MSVDVKYRTSATAHGGRDGESRTDDGALAVKLAVPKEMGGPGGGNNPEQLFAAGYAACFLGAMKFVASQNKDGPQVPNDAAVQTRRHRPALRRRLRPRYRAQGHAARRRHDQAEALVEKAHQVCPYSNATRGNVPVRLSVA